MKNLLSDVLTLTPGAHVHLDQLIPDPPSPGSRAWLPIIAELVDGLVGTGENWSLIFPIGSVSEPCSGDVSIDSALDLANQSNLMEPPSVHRLPGRLLPNRWEGEDHRWLRVLGPAVTEVISMARSIGELAVGEDLEVRVVFEIRASA